jgi:hypothetical protein
MDLKNNNKEIVHSRLKQTAAKIWGFRESDMEGFDPLIELLFGACSAEFEQLSTELYNSQSRILEKVAQILLPEVDLRPAPSYAILQAKPVNAERMVDQTDQFMIDKEFMNTLTNKAELKKIFFSPTSNFRLIDAEVLLLVTAHEIIQISGLHKETIIRSQTHQVSHQHKLWLGLKINPSIKSLRDTSFYFDWFNNPNRVYLLKLLQLAHWFIDGKEISTKSGFSDSVESLYKDVTIDISSFLDINLKTEKKVNQFFEESFVTITEDVLPEKYKYIPLFADFFPIDELEKLKEKLAWIEISLPEIFPVESIVSVFCTPNAFPVLNRRLYNSNRPYTLNVDLNIFPLITEDMFFTIRQILSSNHINYQEVPFKKASDFAPGTYTVRSKGVKRFDERDAYEYVEYLLELLREERVAFKSIGTSMIEKELNDLLIIINRIRLNVLKPDEVKDNTHFIIMKSEVVEDIWLEYWTTTGTFGNNIPKGTLCLHNDFDKKCLRLLTVTMGGKNPPDQLERTYLFKNELLTRNRLITNEDIRVFCQAELGNELKNVTITQQAVMGKNRSTGFHNCILVRLALKEGKSMVEKEGIANHMEKSLQQKSSCIYRYKVECVD